MVKLRTTSNQKNMYKCVKNVLVTASVTFLCICVTSSHAKYYDTKCNLMQEILQISNVSVEEAAKWSCVGRLSTHYDSGGFIGVFQIGSAWWCSPNRGGICNMNCSSLMDDDIRDDFVCAQQIYKGFGNTFEAWPGSDYCLKNQVSTFLTDCVVTRPLQVTKKLPEIVRGEKHRKYEENGKEPDNPDYEHEDEHPEDDFT